MGGIWDFFSKLMENMGDIWEELGVKTTKNIDILNKTNSS